MIYLVSNIIDTHDMPDVKKLSVEESLDIIVHWPVVQFDTETSGLDPHVNSLISMQFGYKHFDTGEHTEIVVDCKSIDPKEYKYVLEKQHIIGHNLKFDLQFLYNYGIVPLNVYDTFICEQVLYLGYKPGRVSMRLSDVLLRNTGIELDKTFQKQISKKGLTKEGIRYAANDVVHLQDIRKAQISIAKSRKCEKAFVVENRFVPAIAYLEWCGIHLDVDKWSTKMKSDKELQTSCRKVLDEYIVNHPKLGKKFMAPFTQLDLFNPQPKYVSSCAVNWDSAKQVLPVVQALGFNTKTKDGKDSVEEKQLSHQKGIDDKFLQLYFEYKGADKNVSTYGQNFLNLINPDTGRLHTVFHQLGTVTGRMSSGSDTPNRNLAEKKMIPASEVKFVNLQNLPARGEAGKITRACFTAEDGNAFVSCDYSAEESRVQADVWNEKSLLESFEHGIDTHNLYAKMCFPEELKDIDVKDVKAKRPDLRQAAKSAEFAVGYGSDGSSIASAIGMPVDKARAMVQGILKGMPGMANFKKKTGQFLKENGYIIINHDTGHRVYWPEWAEWKAKEDRFDRAFWEDYRANHKGTNDEVCKMIRKHMSEGHDWFEKNVLNYPIQGGSAIVLKQAAADLFEWIVKNNYFGKILFCVFVHDEIDVECPKKIASKLAKKMEEIMEQASGKFYKRIKIPSESSVGSFWIH